MNWYAAHLVMYVRIKSGHQQRFPVWENIVLIQAKSEQDALSKATLRGGSDAGDDDGSLLWGGKPAEWIFAGVRKLTLCEDSAERPGDGSEVSFTELELPSKAAIEKFVEGEAVSVRFKDRFAENPPQDEIATAQVG